MSEAARVNTCVCGGGAASGPQRIGGSDSPSGKSGGASLTSRRLEDASCVAYACVTCAWFSSASGYLNQAHRRVNHSTLGWRVRK